MTQNFSVSISFWKTNTGLNSETFFWFKFYFGIYKFDSIKTAKWRASKSNKKSTKICHVSSCFVMKKSVLYNIPEIVWFHFFCVKFTPCYYINWLIKFWTILYYEQLPYHSNPIFEKTYESIINENNYNMFSTAKNRSNGVIAF